MPDDLADALRPLIDCANDVNQWLYEREQDREEVGAGDIVKRWKKLVGQLTKGNVPGDSGDECLSHLLEECARKSPAPFGRLRESIPFADDQQMHAVLLAILRESGLSQQDDLARAVSLGRSEVLSAAWSRLSAEWRLVLPLSAAPETLGREAADRRW